MFNFIDIMVLLIAVECVKPHFFFHLVNECSVGTKLKLMLLCTFCDICLFLFHFFLAKVNGEQPSHPGAEKKKTIFLTVHVVDQVNNYF